MWSEIIKEEEKCVTFTINKKDLNQVIFNNKNNRYAEKYVIYLTLNFKSHQSFVAIEQRCASFINGSLLYRILDVTNIV